LPFSNKGTEFVRGEVEAVEVCETVLALYFVNSELDLAESMVFIGLEVGEGDFKDSALESVVGVFETSCTVDEGFANSKKRSASA
jgi:hypothetical protein